MAGKEQEKKQAKKEQAGLQSLADIYTFVRSTEINRTIANKTFDHFIKEAIEKISSENELKDAAGAVVATRPSKLEALNRLEQSLDDTIALVESIQKSKKKEGDKE